MSNDLPAPLHYKGVMVSSTFTDLQKHRSALIKAIKGQGLTDVAMENDSALPDKDVVDSSLQMVRDASAYIAVIGHKYGQIPECAVRNPERLSLTELEFNEARRLGRPVLLFIMGDDHDVKRGDVETDAEKAKKLKAFRENAKPLKSDSSVHRVYKAFNDLHEFELAATQSIGGLRRYLDLHGTAVAAPPVTVPPSLDPIPTPPAFYAEPPYIGSHQFVGRQAQLDTLNDWASPADSHPVLLFEAIGGAGKSMLTWEWTTRHATTVRQDWAGGFWYSFYEKGAIMADFCQRSLAYITGQPLEDFRKKKTLELSEQLLHHLQARPWLLILDGLERVLVAYHRFDAAQLADEEAGTVDQIAHRDPCAGIRPEDDDLLRALAAASPSKLLLTSRLIPRVLLNAASQPIPGVLRERLPGLRSPDAEALLRSCDIRGTSQAIQSYLKSHCDCHPLVTGVLAGLIHDYLPDRGNFDAWADDPTGGGKLNLANLNLVQKRNHILHAALAALPDKSRQLLSTLALLSEAVDYSALSALNPHLPGKPATVEAPQRPENSMKWKSMSQDERKRAKKDYRAAIQRRNRYDEALKTMEHSPEFLAAPQELPHTVRDLERRGLLQYDEHVRRYNLHPVVRGIAAGSLRQAEKEQYGQRVVDYFSEQTHSPYSEAETLDDLRGGLHVVRALLQMGRYKQAFDAYIGDLHEALAFNLEAHVEILSLLRPYFPQRWTILPDVVSELHGSALATGAANALHAANEDEQALGAYSASLLACLRCREWTDVRGILGNIANALQGTNRLAKQERCLVLGLDLAALRDSTADTRIDISKRNPLLGNTKADLLAHIRPRGRVSIATQWGSKADLFAALLSRYSQLTEIGRWVEADATWRVLDPMGRDWRRNLYRSGDAEYCYAELRFSQGNATEEHLICAEELAKAGKNRGVIRGLHRLRGEWRLEQGEWERAADSLHEAVRMAREVGQIDARTETQLALAKYQLKQLPNPQHEAEQLGMARNPDHRALADLWRAIGDREQATKHALAAYEWAWADGEPYVHRYELNKARALLEQLGAEIPNLPPYDPAKDEKLHWEDEVAAAIEMLRAEKEAKGRKEE